MLVTVLLMFFDPTMSGIALSKEAKKKLTIKSRFELAVQRTWELSKQGPIFKALAWCIRKGFSIYVDLLRKIIGAKKLDGIPKTPTFVKLVQNDRNGVAIGWEVEPSSRYGVDRTVLEYGVEGLASESSTAAATVSTTFDSSNSDGNSTTTLEPKQSWTWNRVEEEHCEP